MGLQVRLGYPSPYRLLLFFGAVGLTDLLTLEPRGFPSAFAPFQTPFSFFVVCLLFFFTQIHPHIYVPFFPPFPFFFFAGDDTS